MHGLHDQAELGGLLLAVALLAQHRFGEELAAIGQSDAVVALLGHRRASLQANSLAAQTVR